MDNSVWTKCSGASPYPGIAAEHLCHMLKSGYRMDKPTACSDQMYAQQCCLLSTGSWSWSCQSQWRSWSSEHCSVMSVKVGKGSPYSITERRVPQLISDLGSQPAGDVSHKPASRLPLLSARPAVILATLKRAATNFAQRHNGCEQFA